MKKHEQVLLINPSYFGSHYRAGDLPAGLGYVSEALNRAGIENMVFDFGLGHTFSDLQHYIWEFRPDLIGLGMMSFRHKQTYRLIEDIRLDFPQVTIVVGGPHLSTLREQVLEDCSAVDFGITLEGEETLVELCQGITPTREIKGLLCRESSGHISYAGDRPFMTDLDGNSFPTYTRFELNRYPLHRSIVTSRGCPYSCIYCPARLSIGTAFRYRSAGSVADEFEYWHRLGVRDFDIADDNFTLQRERVLEICDELEGRDITGLMISCGNGVRADKVDRALLKRMKEVGFYYLAFGVEAGNDNVLQRLKKNQRIENIEQAIADACELGYRVTLFFLIGSPGETKSDVEDSIRLATKYPVYDVRFYNLIPFPGTELYEWVKQHGYFLREDYLNDASHWVNEPIFETPELNRKQRRDLYNYASRVVGFHTLPVKREFHIQSTVERFEALGFPERVSEVLSQIYWSGPFYRCFRQTGLVEKVRPFFGL